MRLFLYGATLGFGFAAVAGWLYIYQYAAYGNPLAWQQVVILNSYALRNSPLTFIGLLQMLPRLLATYWGGFGNAIEFPAWVDVVASAAALFMAAGFAVAFIRRRIPAPTLILFAAVLSSFAALVTWAINYTATENSRLLGPVFGIVPILAAIGLNGWLPERSGSDRSIIAGLAVITAIWAGLAPLFSLIPGYANRRLLPADQRIQHTLSDAEVRLIPAGAPVSFDNGFELLYAALDKTRIDSGGSISITFYWRVNRPVAKMYSLVLEAFDDQGTSLLHVSRAPMNGAWDTVNWYAGDVLKDVEVISLTAHKVAAPSIVRVYVGWHEYDPPYRLVRVAGSTAVSAQVAEVKIRNPHPLEQKPKQAIDARFQNELALEGYDLNGDTLKLYWRAIATPRQNYTVFVHGTDDAGNMVAQNDAPFQYPVNLWDAGEQVVELRRVPGLSKAVHIQIGIYRPATGERLVASHADGTLWPDNAVVIK